MQRLVCRAGRAHQLRERMGPLAILGVFARGFARAILVGSLAVLWPQVARAALPAPAYLTGGWRLARAGEVTVNGSQLSQAGFNDSSWLPALVKPLWGDTGSDNDGPEPAAPKKKRKR